MNSHPSSSFGHDEPSLLAKCLSQAVSMSSKRFRLFGWEGCISPFFGQCFHQIAIWPLRGTVEVPLQQRLKYRRQDDGTKKAFSNSLG
jgi:hypothetical protein